MPVTLLSVRGWEGEDPEALRKRQAGLAEVAGKGKPCPLPPSRLPITIKHFNDLLSDEPLDVIIIHHVSLREEKKRRNLASITCPNLALAQ